MSVEQTSARGDKTGAASSVGGSDTLEARPRRGMRRRGTYGVVFLVLLLLCACLWLTLRVIDVRNHLTSASTLVSQLKTQMTNGKIAESREILGDIKDHTRSALSGVRDPLWQLSSGMPLVGTNFAAVSELAEAANSVASEAAEPLLNTFDPLTSGLLTPKGGGIDLRIFSSAAPNIVTAARTTDAVTTRLEAVDRSNLLTQIANPLDEVLQLLHSVRGPLNEAARLSGPLPEMLGSVEPRNYLILIQNNAELRATGGLAGALAVIRVDHGKIEMTAQTTASALGKFVPPIPVDPEQEHIYSNKLGKQVSGANLTPDFPTAAQTAKSMWETRFGTSIDGVIALDPIVLSHLLRATGPLHLDSGQNTGLPTSLSTALTADNVTKVLLSDTYTTLDYTDQDKFFAEAAKSVFAALTSGKAPGAELLNALAQSAVEDRLKVWSSREQEQRVLSSSAIGGSVLAGPDATPGSFGVFFNDGTGSKMDYYVRHTVQLVHECAVGGYGQTTVKVTLTNDAPIDAATSLPAGVTGGGAYGVPPGVVQTNVVAYGPPEAHVNTAIVNGTKSDFAPFIHGNRPVGVVSIRVAPGETRTLEFLFSEVSMQTQSHVVVTPTVQDVKDVVVPPLATKCNSE